MTEIIRELTATKETNNITNEQVLCWTKRVVVQRAQRAFLKAIKETKELEEFDAVKKAIKQTHNTHNAKRNKGPPQKKCKYYGTLN